MDLERKLTRVALVDYFQDCSTFQSEECGNGLAYLREQGKAWMILSWQIEIARRPVLGERIVTQTWAHEFKAFYGYRNYVMQAADGETLARANSVWVLMDVETGHPAKVTTDIVRNYGLEPPLSMEECSRKIKVPEGQKKMDALTVCCYHLDTNRHVNNGQYIRMAEEYLPAGFEPKRLRVEYRRQAKLHDMIVPMVHREQDQIVVSLCDEQGKPYAIVEYR
jgi:acyl-ACP thioesterase